MTLLERLKKLQEIKARIEAVRGGVYATMETFGDMTPETLHENLRVIDDKLAEVEAMFDELEEM